MPYKWIQAIQSGNFATWPGLTAEAVRKHLPKSTATVKGHLNQQRRNVRSTQLQVSTPNLKSDPIIDPDLNVKTHQMFAATIKITGQISTDLTGRFPVTSSRGNKYLLVLYDYDSNSILTDAMKNRSDNKHLHTYKKLHQYLVERGFRPQLQKLDNEASAALKRSIREKGIDFQLVPTHIH